MKTQKQRDH